MLNLTFLLNSIKLKIAIYNSFIQADAEETHVKI